jgi:DNA-binding NarL/FixJ family response regulator
MPGTPRHGESFLAEIWFSSYKEGATPKLAAIIADVTEERSGAAESTSAASDHQERAILNGRQSDVLRLLVQGLANKEIASRLNVPESVVKNTLQLFAKTEVNTRSQLVRVALECYRDIL